MSAILPIFGGALITWRRGLTGTCLLLLLPAGFVHAEVQPFCAIFCGARDQLQDTAMTPIRQLEGDVLFESAAALRERVMTSEQRLLNQFWLHDTATTRIQGGRVWSRLLRYSVKQIQMQKASYDPIEKLSDDDSLSTGSGDYQLRLSGDNIRLVVHYSF